MSVPGIGVAAAIDGRVRPDRVHALRAAAAGLVLAGVHQHQVVDDAVRLEDVAVTVDVALVLDVVVGPGEVRVARGQRVDRVLGRAGPAPAGLSGWPFIDLDRPGDPVAVRVRCSA